LVFLDAEGIVFIDVPFKKMKYNILLIYSKNIG